MRIGFVIHEFPPSKILGGTGRYAASVAKSLVALGHEVTVFCFNGYAAEGRFYEFDQSWDGIPVHRVSPRMPTVADTVAHPEVEAAFMRWLDRTPVDIVHFQHTISLSLALPQMAKARGIKVVMSMHDFWMTCHRAHMNFQSEQGQVICTVPVDKRQCSTCVVTMYGLSGDDGLLPLLHAREELAIQAMASSDLLLFGAVHTRKAFEETLGWKGNYATLPYGIEPAEPLPAPKLGTSIPTFGFMGNITKIKGLEVLLEAFRAVGDRARLLVFGEFADDPAYQEKLEALGDHPSVTFYGRYDLAKALSLMDALVIPSLLENYPLVALEAFMAGVPIIGSRVGGIAEVVTDGVDGMLFERGNATDLARVLRLLVDAPERLLALREGVHPPMTVEQHTDRLVAHYESLVSPKIPLRKDLKVSIVIPLYNRVEYTQACLEALVRTTPEDHYEVILVDNASTDGTAEFLKALDGDVKIISNPVNLGFAKACNQGAAVADGEYILFLNYDTVPHPGWFEPLVQVLETEPDVAAVGGKLLFPDGTLQHAGVAVCEDQVNGLPMSGMHRFYRMPGDYPSANQRTDLQVLTGAALLIRRALFDEVGGFDEAYWNGYEDIDLCFKLGQKGYRLVYEPKSCLTHHESVSGPERRVREDQNLNLLIERWTGRVVPDVIITPEKTERIHPLRSPVSVVIVSYNSSTTIAACVESTLATLREGDEIVVVDNASSDDTPRILQRLEADNPRVKSVLSTENLGFSAGCNLGVHNAKGRYIVLLNPDTRPMPGWLDQMMSLVTLPDVGAVGPTSDYVAGQQKWQLHVPASLPKDPDIEQIAVGMREANNAKGHETKLLIGFCMLIPRDLYEELGGLDEELFLGNDDLDISWRLRQMGKKLVVATGAFVHHIGQVSFNTEPKEHVRKLVRESTDALARKLVRHYGPGKVPPPRDLWDMDWFSPSPGLLEYGKPLPKGAALCFASARKEQWRPLLESYLAAFADKKGVALRLAVEDDADQALGELAGIIDALGYDPEHIPDVELAPVGSEEERVAVLAEADRVLDGTETPEALREVYDAYARPPLTSIVLLGYNQLNYTRLCVESVLANTDRPFELILVDNGSSDGTGEYFRELEATDSRVNAVLNENNLGFAAGCNQGISLSTGDYVLFLNNDTVVPRGWLDRMLSHFRDPHIGAVGAVSNCVSGPQQLPDIPFANHPDAMPAMEQFAEAWAERTKGQGFELGRLVGFCLMVRREVLDRIGGFDPQFGNGNFEDDDFSLRIRSAGWKTWVALDAYVHHFGSRTFSALGSDAYAESLDRGWSLFKAKWGLDPNLDRKNGYRVDLPAFDPGRHRIPVGV